MCIKKIIIQAVRPGLGTPAMALVSFNSMYLFGYNLEYVFIQKCRYVFIKYNLA